MAEVAGTDDAGCIDLVDIDAVPNGCPLEAPLHVIWQYRTSVPVAGCSWDVSFVLDVAHLAHVLHLGRLPAADAAADVLCRAELSCAGLEVANLAPSLLNNVALLQLKLLNAEGVTLGVVACLSQTARPGCTARPPQL